MHQLTLKSCGKQNVNGELCSVGSIPTTFPKIRYKTNKLVIMKVNKIVYDQIKIHWDITQMTSAYINAEKILIQRAAESVETFEPMSPEEFHHYQVDGFGNIKNLTPKDLIKQKMESIEAQGRKLLEQEKYELFAELKEIYEKYKQEYDRL